MAHTPTTYFRKSAELSKRPKKRHGKQTRFMEINKDTTTNPHAKQKKASSRNPKGKSRISKGGRGKK